MKSEDWTFLACVSLRAGHTLSFLATRWGTTARDFITCRSVGSTQDVDCIRIAPVWLRRNGEIVLLRKKDVGVFFSSNKLIDHSSTLDPSTFTFSYQQDVYVLLSNKPPTFALLPYTHRQSPLFVNTSSKLEHGSAQRRMKREDCLQLAS